MITVDADEDTGKPNLVFASKFAVSFISLEMKQNRSQTPFSFLAFFSFFIFYLCIETGFERSFPEEGVQEARIGHYYV